MLVQGHPEGEPVKVVVVGGDIGSGSGNGSGSSPAGTEVSLLGAGSAAGSVQHPGTVVLNDLSVLLNFGASNEATTADFTFFLLDMNGRKSVFPGIRKNGSIAQVTSGKVGDVVSFQVPAGCKLRIEHTAATGGGTISIKGVVR